MEEILDIYKKTGRLHHAYAILGDKKKVKEEVTSFLSKELKFPTAGNPDFWYGEFNVLKIVDSRKIHEAHVSKPVKYERKIFIIVANFITKDAQNSFLKIFEEPKAETTFFLIMPEGTELLPTLKSRLIFARDTTAPNPSLSVQAGLTNEGEKLNAEEFLQAKVGKRLQIVTKIIKEIKDEKINKADIIIFLKNLEQEMKKQKNLSAIEPLENAISYMADESPSVKVILEHLAITV